MTSIQGNNRPERPIKSKITVCVRLRPTIQEDYQHAHVVRNGPEICVHLKSDGQTVKIIQDRFHSRLFKVDHTLNSTVSQTEVYNIAMKPIVNDVLRGYNGTAIAYGPNNSGKTYTMFGNEHKLGMAHFAVTDIFDRVDQYEERGLVAKVFMSFYQVYVEQVYDLLAEMPSSKSIPLPSLNIREDNVRGVYLENLSTYNIKDKATANALIAEGLMKRKAFAVNYNIKPSRAHTVFQIFIDLEENTAQANEEVNRSASSDETPLTNNSSINEYEIKKFVVRRRKLVIVDLAGTERVSSHRNTSKQQVKENSIINKSIVALGNCISALANQNMDHVPFRDSKLTRLLAETLSGNSKACLFTNISPCFYNYEETYSALKFATRAKLVQKIPRTNSGHHSFRNPYLTDTVNDDMEAPPDTQLLTYVHKEKHPKQNGVYGYGSSNSMGQSQEEPNYYSYTEDHNDNRSYSSAAGSDINVNAKDADYYRTIYSQQQNQNVNVMNQQQPPAQYYSNHAKQHQSDSEISQHQQQFRNGPQQRPYYQHEEVHPFDPKIDIDNNHPSHINQQPQQPQQPDFFQQNAPYDPTKPPLQYKKLLSGNVSVGNNSQSNFSLKDFLKACTVQNNAVWNPEKKPFYDHSSNTSDIDESTLQDDYYESDFYHQQTQPGNVIPGLPPTEHPILRNLSKDSSHHTQSFSTPLNKSRDDNNIKTRSGMAVGSELKINLHEHGDGQHNDELSHFLSSDEELSPFSKKNPTPKSIQKQHSNRKHAPSFQTQSTGTSPSLPMDNQNRFHGHNNKTNRSSAISSPSISRVNSGNLFYASGSQIHPSDQNVITGEPYLNPENQKIMVDKGIQSNKLRPSQLVRKFDGSLNDFAVFTESIHDKTTEMDYDLLLSMDPNINIEYCSPEDIETMKQSIQNPFSLLQEVQELKQQVLERDVEIERLKKFILDQV